MVCAEQRLYSFSWKLLLKGDREKSLANYKEAARQAKRAVKRSITVGKLKDECKAYQIWALAALEFNPAQAYQVAERALSLTSDFACELKEIRHRALSELGSVPRKDLLGLDD